MKIGILTFHCAHNYGAVLQAYGLQEYLKSQGHEVHIIDYRPEYLTRIYRRNGICHLITKSIVKTCAKLLSEPFLFKIRRNTWDKFDQFINSRLDLAPYAKEELDKYDVIVAGSDQIWNARLTGGTLDNVFLGEGIQTKVISYAASARLGSIDSAQMEYLRKSFKNFAAISVREYTLKEILQPLTSKPITTVLDPTLLAGRAIFDKIAERPNIPHKYVFIYNISYYRQTRNIATDIAQQIGGSVIELISSLRIRIRHRNMQLVYAVSPEEFLGLIKHAACVVTTSFHGTALSLCFQRPFYAVRQGKGIDSRYESLLNKLNLQHRLISMNARPKFEEIDYSPVNKLLSQEIGISKEFIEKAISLPADFPNETSYNK